MNRLLSYYDPQIFQMPDKKPPYNTSGPRATTKEDKEITMYPEDLTVDCDEVYEGICEELRFRGIEVTKAGFRWTINIELLQEDDDE